MSDRLLRELGDLARSETKAEKARFDDRWDHLTAGTLTAEEEAELKALSESSPEYQEAFEAFRPLGADFQARVVSAIQSKPASERAAEERQQESQELRRRVRPFRPVIRRVEVWAGFAVAVAAGVFFMVRASAPMPGGYEAHFNAGDQTLRGGELRPANGIPTFSSGSRLELSVSPLHPIPGAVKPQVFLSSSAGEENLEPWKPESGFQIADKGGAMRLVGTLGQDFKLPPGDKTIWIVVGRPGRMPRVDEVQSRLRSGRTLHEPWRSVCAALHSTPSRPAPWQVACAELRIESHPPS